MDKKLLTIFVAILLVLVGFSLLQGNGNDKTPGSQPNTSQIASEVLAALRESGSLGAVASPDIPSPYISWGGLRYWNRHTTSLTQATTTVCALQSPAATSTLSHASIRFTVGTTTNAGVVMAKAATAYATTTALGGTMTLLANEQGTVIASTTVQSVFAPSTYLVVGMTDQTAEATAGTFSPSGVCQATFIEIQ